VPSGFGALVATWGAPLLEHHRDLGDLRARALAVSLSGAAGTGTMIGPDPAAIRAGVARALDLPDPGTSWHAERHRFQRIAAWMTGCATAAGKIGEDLLRLSRSEVAELGFAASGASSTMPQKQNPVAASTLVALHRFSVAQQSALMSAPHGEARDGAAWFTEWLALPQLIAASGKALAVLAELIPALVVDADAMRARVEAPLGLIHAETLSFALAAILPRAEAQAVVKSLAAKALATGTPLPDLIRAAHPDAALPDLAPEATMGAAPAEARAFAKAVRAHLT
jgi:3-carboxy-cis,cis-muconate cycloisomerase